VGQQIPLQLYVPCSTTAQSTAGSGMALSAAVISIIGRIWQHRSQCSTALLFPRALRKNRARSYLRAVR